MAMEPIVVENSNINVTKHRKIFSKVFKQQKLLLFELSIFHGKVMCFIKINLCQSTNHNDQTS